MDGKIGVLALQGDWSEHIQAFEQVVLERGLSMPVIEVRHPADMEGLVALAMPGGESTTIMRLIDQNGMRQLIQNLPEAFLQPVPGWSSLPARWMVNHGLFTRCCGHESKPECLWQATGII